MYDGGLPMDKVELKGAPSMTQEFLALLLFVGMVALWVVLPTSEVREEGEVTGSVPVHQLT